MRYLRNFILLVLVSALVFAGCAKVQEPDNREHDYGYVQFKLYKEASYEGTKAEQSQLEYLKDVAKVRVTLKYNDDMISQTLVMTASNDEAAEYGLRSDKLKLLAGNYQVLAYTLYNKVDEAVYADTPAEGSGFEVVPGGLSVHDLVADVVARGKVRFNLVKDLSSVVPGVVTVSPVSGSVVVVPSVVTV